MTETLGTPAFLVGKEALIIPFDDTVSYLPDGERDPKFNHDYLRAFLEALMRKRVITLEQAIVMLDDATHVYTGLFQRHRTARDGKIANSAVHVLKRILREHDIEIDYEIEEVKTNRSDNLAHDMRGALRRLHSIVVGDDNSALFVPRFGNSNRMIEIVDPCMNPLVHGRQQYPLAQLATDVSSRKGNAFIIR